MSIVERLRGPHSPDILQAVPEAIAEIERLRAALEECAKGSYLDEHDLEFRPTKEALIARQALG